MAHTTFYCREVHKWLMSYMPLTCEVGANCTFLDLASWASKADSLEDFAQFCVIAWSLWKCWNTILYDQ